MGLIRKTASISTLGLIGFRSNGEQTKRIAKQTRNAARAQVVQNQMMIANQRAQIEAQVQANGYQMARDIAPIQPVRQLPPGRPAGWYADPTDASALCWWDGKKWMPATKHYPNRELR
jgi:hypothetical protein